MEIRDALPADAAEVRRVVTAAFGDGRDGHGGDVADLWDDVVAAGHVRASMVAVEDGETVGHVGVSHAWVDARRELVDVLVLGPLSVVPDDSAAASAPRWWRPRSRPAWALEAPAMFLEGDPAWYAARGFAPGRDHGFLPASDRTPGPAFQVVLYEGHEDWMSGRLIYRDVWWAHDSAGLRDPLLAELEQGVRLTFEQVFDMLGGCPSSHRPAGRPRSGPPTRPAGSTRRSTGCWTCARRSTAPIPTLRRHAVVLARFAVLHVEASQAAVQPGAERGARRAARGRRARRRRGGGRDLARASRRG